MFNAQRSHFCVDGTSCARDSTTVFWLAFHLIFRLLLHSPVINYMLNSLLLLLCFFFVVQDELSKPHYITCFLSAGLILCRTVQTPVQNNTSCRPLPIPHGASFQNIYDIIRGRLWPLMYSSVIGCQHVSFSLSWRVFEKKFVDLTA